MDAHLRTIERHMAAGDPTARQQLLRARARAGQLPQLHLLAYLGDRDAQALLGPDAPLIHHRSRNWYLGLANYGKRVPVHAAIIAGRMVAPAWAHLGLDLALTCLHVAEEWLRCPCELHRKRAAVLARSLVEPTTTTGRTAYNIVRAVARRDRNRTDEATAARLAAGDAASAAWNVRRAFRALPPEQLAVLSRALGFRGPFPPLGFVRAAVTAKLRVT